MNFYRHNIGDYRRDTHHLSLLEHGIYRQMLDQYYLDENPLPLDEKALMRSLCVRSADEVQAFKNVLQDFFEETKNGYVHKRCEVEIQKIYDKSEKARKSAKRRWSKENQEDKDVDNADGMRTHSERNANGMLPSNPVTHNPRERSISAHSGQYTPEFEDAWKAYPKRKGGNPKPKAAKAWSARLREGHTPEELKAGVVRYSRWVKAEGKEHTEFVQQAATFFGPNKAFQDDWEIQKSGNDPFAGAI